jgi:hypothetical protein
MEEVKGNCKMMSFMILSSHQIVLRWSDQGGRNGQGMWPVWWRGDRRREFRWENLKERNHSEDLSVYEKTVL